MLNEQRYRICGVGVALALIVGGCANPAREQVVTDAEAAFNAVENNPEARELAGVDLDRTSAALDELRRAEAEGEETAELRHLGYLVERRADITRFRADERSARNELEELAEERDQILLAAERDRATAAEQEAQSALREAQEARARAEQLEAELQDLEAEQTARGLVLTLDDVLFEFDTATLKPGGEAQVDRIAEALSDLGDRPILVEGHTDNVGSETYNLQLSRDRAEAVRQSLIAGGIAPDRIRARGLGESYPVTANDTEAGRQQNRRVEIVIDDQLRPAGA
ncbi:MAG: OmpA family protein [Geminicoccaceae bacterium]